MEVAREPASLPADGRQRRMPALAGGTHGYTHSIHSALVSLAALEIGAAQIVLRRAGRDAHAPGTIVRQRPAPGTVLTGSMLIELDVAGLGFTHALPVGMWDSGGESAAGTREVLEPLDDPLEKLKHWFHEGAPLFRLAPEDAAACARWLALFGVQAEEWPRALWYRLASLIAEVAQLSCSEEGCAFALEVLLGLPMEGFSYHPTLAMLTATDLSRLGSHATRLGVDFVLGDAVEDLATTEIAIGPVALEVYEFFAETKQGAALLRRVLELLRPISPGYDVHWSVEDRTQPPRLGIAKANSRLGLNTHLGAARPEALPDWPAGIGSSGGTASASAELAGRMS